jgi:ribosomal protein L40E
MAQKTEGFIELEWTCPNCQSNNPGPQKTCQNCGSPQPTDVTFHLPGEAKLKTDEATAQLAAAGPDIHCPYCNSRNPGNATECAQCGGDLTGGTRRQTGQVVGAFSTVPGPQVTCANCGHLNPASALQCVQCGSPLQRPLAAPLAATPPAAKKGLPVILIVIGLIAICGLFFLLSNLFKTETVSGSVQQVAWSRVIKIEALQNVTKRDFRDDIPSGAKIGSCAKEYFTTQDQPAPVATEVCGTSYVVDKGSGLGEVVKDCTYRVYEDKCDYTVQAWTTIDQSALQGSDLNPRWPSPNLQSNQRIGGQDEVYTIQFMSNDKILTYKTSDYDTFARCQIGTNWNLEVSATGQVVSISPIQ